MLARDTISSRKETVSTMMLGLLALAALGDAVRADEPEPARVRETEEVTEVLAAEPAVDYEILAVRIGTSANARRNLFVADPTLPARIEVAFAFWIVRGEGRVILVDTGFVSRRMIERWKIEGYREPVRALLGLGVRAEQVTDVIVTHSHWDHIGTLGRFVNARVWINEVELEAWKGRRKGKPPRAIRAAKQQQRLCLTRGVEVVAPGIVAIEAGQHTPGFQYVVVKTGGGPFVLASDIAPLFANFERWKASGQTSDPEQALAVQEEMLGIVGGDLGRIVPGHEPGIFADGNVVVIHGGRDSGAGAQVDDPPPSADGAGSSRPSAR
jgi:glyoxylase-like metal-dependent hydrolase (beta-lactamase superfamily II)